jgi:hypothetical protein
VLSHARKALHDLNMRAYPSDFNALPLPYLHICLGCFRFCCYNIHRHRSVSTAK